MRCWLKAPCSRPAAGAGRSYINLEGHLVDAILVGVVLCHVVLCHGKLVKALAHIEITILTSLAPKYC